MVRMQGAEVAKVEEFNCLGSTVQSNWECGREVRKRVQEGWSGWGGVLEVICNRRVPVRVKEKVYRMVGRSAMLYDFKVRH